MSRIAFAVNLPAGPEGNRPRVLAVVPGDASGQSFIFARRQILDVMHAGMNVQTFNVENRTSLKGLIREWRRLRCEIAEFQPDIVHAHYGTVTAFLCACASSAPLVVTYRGSDLNGCPGIGRFRKYAGLLLSQLAALRAHAIICVSPNLRRKLWWGSSKVSIVPSGVDMQLFCPADRHRARGLLGWSDEESIVLFNAGREPELKGLPLATQVLSVAARLVGSIQFVVLHGEVSPEKVPTYINAADCVLVCSISEGSPNIVKEALACNVPVVAVDVGDVKDLLSGVFPSGLTNKHDSEKLGEVLAGVLRVGTRSNGRQMIERVSHDRVARAVCNIYRGLVDRNEC